MLGIPPSVVPAIGLVGNECLAFFQIFVCWLPRITTIAGFSSLACHAVCGFYELGTSVVFSKLVYPTSLVSSHGTRPLVVQRRMRIGISHIAAVAVILVRNSYSVIYYYMFVEDIALQGSRVGRTSLWEETGTDVYI